MRITSHAFTPSSSLIFASSLASAILTSRKVFSISLHISAVVDVVRSISPSTMLSYTSFTASEDFSLIPPTIRLFVRSSSITLPGRIRSGECATSSSSPISRPVSLSMGSIRSSTVLGGDVDSSTTMLPFFTQGTTALVADSTKRISAVLSGFMGVGTAIIYTSQSRGQVVCAVRKPFLTTSFTRSPRPGSSMIISPLLSAFTAFSLRS